jgi:hypothetical protein
MFRSLLQSLCVLGATLLVVALARSVQGEAVARAASFLTLVLGNLGLIFSSRSVLVSSIPLRCAPLVDGGPGGRGGNAGLSCCGNRGNSAGPDTGTKSLERSPRRWEGLC